MLPDYVLVFGQVDAEGLVIDDVGMVPLDFAGELGQRIVRGRCRVFLYKRDVIIDNIGR